LIAPCIGPFLVRCSWLSLPILFFFFLFFLFFFFVIFLSFNKHFVVSFTIGVRSNWACGRGGWLVGWLVVLVVVVVVVVVVDVSAFLLFVFFSR